MRQRHSPALSQAPDPVAEERAGRRIVRRNGCHVGADILLCGHASDRLEPLAGDGHERGSVSEGGRIRQRRACTGHARCARNERRHFDAERRIAAMNWWKRLFGGRPLEPADRPADKLSETDTDAAGKRPETGAATPAPASSPAARTGTTNTGRTKRKSLPKNFEELLAEGDVAKLRAVFDTCDPNARGGYGKQTALAFDLCPDALARWLVEQGADLSATDLRGNTPLHARSRSRRGRIDVLLELGADVNSDSASIGTPLHAAAASYHVEHARLLLQRGAHVDALNRERLTPLELALRGCSNIDLERVVPLAVALLDAGAQRTPRMKEFVDAIGKRFEFHRAGFNPDSVGAASGALDRLYALFDVRPVPRRRMHDGQSRIVVSADSWQAQHQELWELLVPASGHAATIQGEVIRVSGRIAHELEGNGGCNWDADFNKMADAFLAYIQAGNPLTPSDCEDAATVVGNVKSQSGDPMRLCELAVAWVLLNPAPISLERPPSYRR
ncbi:ankyrin repeat domain-containing protein [Burkholderia sp. MR1-5-21]